MFAVKSSNRYLQALPGIKRKTLAYGEHTLMSEFILDKSAVLPAHSHVQEQTGYLVYGCLQLTIEGETLVLEAGDSWSIPGGVEHRATALEDSLAIEVFSPLREDYLPNRPY
ncbi:MAG: cupin domain-containing protein [Methylocystaceae bacterium]